MIVDEKLKKQADEYRTCSSPECGKTFKITKNRTDICRSCSKTAGAIPDNPTETVACDLADTFPDENNNMPNDDQEIIENVDTETGEVLAELEPTPDAALATIVGTEDNLPDPQKQSASMLETLVDEEAMTQALIVDDPEVDLATESALTVTDIDAGESAPESSLKGVHASRTYDINEMGGNQYRNVMKRHFSGLGDAEIFIHVNGKQPWDYSKNRLLSNWATKGMPLNEALKTNHPIGILILEGSPIVCVDHDHVRVKKPHTSSDIENVLTDESRKQIEKLESLGAYIEVSQSNHGVHSIFVCEGGLPAHKKKIKDSLGNTIGDLFCGQQKGRFIALTGYGAQGIANAGVTRESIRGILPETFSNAEKVGLPTVKTKTAVKSIITTLENRDKLLMEAFMALPSTSRKGAATFSGQQNVLDDIFQRDMLCLHISKGNTWDRPDGNGGTSNVKAVIGGKFPPTKDIFYCNDEVLMSLPELCWEKTDPKTGVKMNMLNYTTLDFILIERLAFNLGLNMQLVFKYMLRSHLRGKRVGQEDRWDTVRTHDEIIMTWLTMTLWKVHDKLDAINGAQYLTQVHRITEAKKWEATKKLRAAKGEYGGYRG